MLFYFDLNCSLLLCLAKHPANCSTALLRYSVEIYKCTNASELHKTQHKSMWVAKIMAYSETCTHSCWRSWYSPSWGDRAVFHYKDLVGDIDRWKCISQRWLDTKIAKGVMVLQFRNVKELCPQFADNIVEDVCQLKDCNFGRKFAGTTQSFWKVPKLPNLSLNFEHATHMACLSVTLVWRKVTRPKPNLLLWPCNVCIVTAEVSAYIAEK